VATRDDPTATHPVPTRDAGMLLLLLLLLLLLPLPRAET
jgi:hypothetical protein